MNRHSVSRLLALAAAFSVAPGVSLPALAQAHPSYDQCRAAAGGVTLKLKACDATEIAEGDATLNHTYQQVLAAVGPKRQEPLRAAERAWVAYRDSECAFRMSAETGGTDAPLVSNSCRIELTAGRIDALKKALRVASF